MYQEVNKITCNDNSHQMESDIAYFILNDNWRLLSNAACHHIKWKESHDNWRLLTNAACHILNVMMDDQILKHLTNSDDNDDKYKRSQMIKFETEHKINSECLFDYHQCGEIVKQTKNFNNDIQENVDKYFKFIIKIFLSVSIVCFVLNYFVVIALFLDNVVLWTFDVVLYCRIISDLLILILIIPYIWYRKYRISVQFVKSGGIHWLDPISFDYFCYNKLDKNYGMKFVLNFVCDYCYFTDIYMNNYIIHQTLLALQKLTDLNGDCFLNLLSDEILNILLNYLWFQPNNKSKNQKRRDYFDHNELKNMVRKQHRKILERLNQLTFIKNCGYSEQIIEMTQNK